MKEKVYHVYKIVNKANGKIYIGGTSQSTADRLREHKQKARNGVESPLYRAIREYGEDCFDICIIEDCYTREELDNRERYWIANLSSTNPEIGYNIKAGGDIFYHTDLTKLKISRLHKGKISEKREVILQYSSDGNFLREYSSLTEAAKDANIVRSTLIRGLNRKVSRPTSKNIYMWFYKSEFTEIPSWIDPKTYYKNLDYKAGFSSKAIASRTNRLTTTGDMSKLVTPVEQYDLEGNLIAKFYGIKEASRQTGISEPTIRRQINDPNYLDSLKTKNKTKFIWKKADPNDPDIQINKEDISKKISSKKTKIIQAFDINGNLVKQYNGIKEFEKAEHADRRTMMNYIIEDLPWRGYYWKIIN